MLHVAGVASGVCPYVDGLMSWLHLSLGVVTASAAAAAASPLGLVLTASTNNSLWHRSDCVCVCVSEPDGGAASFLHRGTPAAWPILLCGSVCAVQCFVPLPVCAWQAQGTMYVRPLWLCTERLSPVTVAVCAVDGRLIGVSKCCRVHVCNAC